jgi:glutathione S-transferase
VTREIDRRTWQELEDKTMPTLYGAPASPFVRKTMAALAEKGIAYEHDPVIPFNPPADYRKISPLGRIPAYHDGDLTLADSSVIIAYLERVKPSPALYPSDTRDYARALWFEEYGDGGMGPVVGPKIFFQKIAKPIFFKQPTDEEVVSKAINEELPPMFDYLEGELGGGDWLVGRSFSVADLSISAMFVQLSFVGVAPGVARWPKLSAYVARALGRPSVAKAVGKAKAMLGLK